MKPDIHPKYQQARVHCGSCGIDFLIGSTREELRMDVCSNCHPFFTGKQKLVDTEGRVDRFQKKVLRAKEAAAVRDARIASKPTVN